MLAGLLNLCVRSMPLSLAYSNVTYVYQFLDNMGKLVYCSENRQCVEIYFTMNKLNF